MAAESTMILADRTDELLSRGRSQGFVSMEEVAELVQGGDLSAAQLEEFYATLEEEEISIVEAEASGGSSGGSGPGGGPCSSASDRPRGSHRRFDKNVPGGDRAGPVAHARRRDSARQGDRPGL